MDKLTLPSESLRDMLGIMSFYNNPSCRISFQGSHLDAVITSDDDLIEVAWRNLEEIKQEYVFFQLTWKTKEIQLKKKKMTYLYYEIKDFYEQCLLSDLPRCLAHEYNLIKDKKIDIENKETDIEKCEESPLVLLARGHPYQSRISKFTFTKEDVKQTLRGIVINNLDNDIIDECDLLADFGILSNNLKISETINCRTDEKTTKKCSQKAVEMDVGFGVEPSMIPNEVNFRKQNYTHSSHIKGGLFIAGLRLFPSYLQKGNIIVDGLTNNNGKTNIIFPLSEKPLSLQEFRLLQRHPHLSQYTKNINFWEKIGVIGFRNYLRKRQGKGDCYFELT